MAVKQTTFFNQKRKEYAAHCWNPQKWNDVQHIWNKKPFLVETLPEIFHVPLPGTYAKAIQRMWKRAQDAGVAPKPNDFLLLAQ